MFRTSQYPGWNDQQGSNCIDVYIYICLEPPSIQDGMTSRDPIVYMYIYMFRTSQYPGWVDQQGSDCI